MLGHDFWILDEDKRPVRARSVREWAEWYERASANDGRRVAETLTEFHRVSTVFLGIDHQWVKGPPILFETMVFETAKTLMRSALDGSLREYHEEMDGECWRYSTWSDAEAGHQTALRRVLRKEANAAKAAADAGMILIKGERTEG